MGGASPLARTLGPAFTLGLALAVGPGQASETLEERQRSWIYAHAGQAIPIGDGESLVIYPPLSLAWIFDGDLLVDDGRVVASTGGGLAIDWRYAGLRDLPYEPPELALPAEAKTTGAAHPLAAAYDRVLDQPLSRALPPLPAGAILELAGTIRGPATEAGGESPVLGLWQNRGTHLRVTLEDGAEQLISLAALAQATQTE